MSKVFTNMSWISSNCLAINYFSYSIWFFHGEGSSRNNVEKCNVEVKVMLRKEIHFIFLWKSTKNLLKWKELIVLFYFFSQ